MTFMFFIRTVSIPPVVRALERCTWCLSAPIWGCSKGGIGSYISVLSSISELSAALVIRSSNEQTRKQKNGQGTTQYQQLAVIQSCILNRGSLTFWIDEILLTLIVGGLLLKMFLTQESLIMDYNRFFQLLR